MSDIIKCDSCGRRVIGQTIGDTLECPSCNATLEAGDSTISTSGITCPFCGETEKYWGRDMDDTRKCPSCGGKVSEEEFEVLDEGGHEEKTDEVVASKNNISDKDKEAPIGDATNESVAPKKSGGETADQQYIETAKQEFFKNKFLLFLWVGMISSAVMVFYYGHELDDIVFNNATWANLLASPKPPLPAGNVTYCMGFMIIGSIFFHLFASLLYKEYTRKD